MTFCIWVICCILTVYCNNVLHVCLSHVVALLTCAKSYIESFLVNEVQEFYARVLCAN